MAKRITNYSKLSKDRKEYINSSLDASELKIIEVNLKKGVIIKIEHDEIFVVLDTWPGFDKREQADSDAEEDEDDHEFDDGDLEENLIIDDNN